MNSAALARTAYHQTTKIAPSERSVEYRVFAQVTARLSAAAQSNSAKDFPVLASAVHENRKLWMVLAADVASDNNALPDALRAQILSLADFTWRHSSQVLKREAEAAPLIDINTAIMRGLRGVTPAGGNAAED